MSPVYITCKVLPGIFDDECYVMVNGSAAYYINAKLIRLEGKLDPNKAVTAQVKGYLIEKDGAKSLVQLPGEAAVGGVRAWVESEAVVAAA
jgi:hypothetical protein